MATVIFGLFFSRGGFKGRRLRQGLLDPQRLGPTLLIGILFGIRDVLQRLDGDLARAASST